MYLEPEKGGGTKEEEEERLPKMKQSFGVNLMSLQIWQPWQINSERRDGKGLDVRNKSVVFFYESFTVWEMPA